MAAEHGLGVGDLLDEVLKRLPAQRRDGRAAAVEPETAVAIIGRPNVGKSSLLNRLLREERAIVSDLPGTTRATVDAVLRWHRRTFRILDTAGIRRPGRVARSGQVEAVSVIVARRAIEQADVAVLMVDATEGATDQDAAIAGEADTAGSGVIVVANKWDLIKGRGAEFVKEFDDDLRRQLKFLDYAPVLHISALTGERTPKLLEMIDRVAESRKLRIPTAELNPLRGPDLGCAADVRVLHERGHVVSFLLRAVPRQSAARVVWSHRHADSSESQEAPTIVADHQIHRPREQTLAILGPASACHPWTRPRFLIGRSSDSLRSAKSRSCSRTCCARGRRSFRTSVSRKRKADPASTAARTSSASSESSICCSSKA
jgi:small GTP-binding protein